MRRGRLREPVFKADSRLIRPDIARQRREDGSEEDVPLDAVVETSLHLRSADV